jgi:ABC-2 type transport system ATP-binding protein
VRLELSEIRKTYPPAFSFRALFGAPGTGRNALSGVSAKVGAGEIVGLVGRNGAGKTTLLKCVLGLLRPDAGAVKIDGVPAAEAGVAQRARIGYVPPVDRAFYLRLSCLENLRFAARLHGLPAREATVRARAALAGVGLAARERDRVESLSSGMRQRLALARALQADPSILLLDEPTRSLDPAARASFHRLIVERRGERGVLIASHDLAEVESLCDRVILLDLGRVVASGTVDDVRRELGLRARYRFRLSAPPPSGLGFEPAGDAYDLVAQDPETLPRAVEALSSARIRVLGIDRTERGLEEAFERLAREEP